MKILLAVDGSEYSIVAADVIANRPWPAGSEVKIINVVRLPFVPTKETKSLPESDYSRIEAAAMEQAQTALDAALNRISAGNSERESPLTITTDIIIGHPQETILAEAEKWQANLIMLGSRGRSGIKRFLLGSISSAVATNAACSVEIARADADHPVKRSNLKILLAVDGSECSDAAVKAVLSCPWSQDTTLKIVSVAEPPKPMAMENLTRSSEYFQEWDKLLEESARTAVEKAAAQFSNSQLTIQTAALKGQPHEAIIKEAENYGADLIVLGSRGLGGFERLLLGSVSQAVLMQARCCVQIVR